MNLVSVRDGGLVEENTPQQHAAFIILLRKNAGDPDWVVRHRFREFEQLVKQMTVEGISSIPPLPKKHLLIRTSSSVQRRQERAAQLQYWLITLIEQAVFPERLDGETVMDRSSALSEFLEMSRGAQTAKEAGFLSLQQNERRQRYDLLRQPQPQQPLQPERPTTPLGGSSASYSLSSGSAASAASAASSQSSAASTRPF